MLKVLKRYKGGNRPLKMASSGTKIGVTRSAVTINPLTGYNVSTGNVMQRFNSNGVIANTITNGDFSSGTTGWGTGSGTLSASNNVLTVVGNGTNMYVTPTYSSSTVIDITHKYYIKANVVSLNAECQNLYMVIKGTTGGTNLGATLSSPVANTSYTISGIYTPSADCTGNLSASIQSKYVDSSTANGKTIQIQQVVVIDLTATFGSGAEPSIDWCNQNIPFFSGSQDVSSFMSSIVPKKIGTVSDEYNDGTGVYTKNISDWINLTGDLTYSGMTNATTVACKEVYANIAAYGAGVNNTELVIKNDGTQLAHFTNINNLDSSCLNSNITYIRINNEDTGFSQPYTPTANEVKSYFYGWKMCQSDGTSPYLPSLVPYTPSTWAEWTKVNNTGTLGSTGATITADGVNFSQINRTNTLKPSTKYGVLYNVVSNNLVGGLLFGGASDSPFASTYLPTVVGNNKFSGTTASTVTLSSLLKIMVLNTETAGNSIKFKDFRIFELPTGSQIEADFTNLTADQLSAKYGFYGLCTKYWKKVTDGSGLTSTLPTASYSGYTPYKMIYQLATPVVTNIGTLAKHGGYGYVGGDTTELTFDLGTKVASSVVECPIRVMSVGSASLLAPSDGTWGTGYIESTQANIDKIKVQEGTTVTASSTTNTYYCQVMFELDLTPVANQLFGGSNAALKSALKSIGVDVWAMGSGSNASVLTNGVKAKIWSGSSWSAGVDVKGFWVGENTTASIANLNKDGFITGLTLGDKQATINTSNKVYILVHATYPSDGTIASSVSLDYAKITIGLNRTVDTVTSKPVVLPKYFACLVKGFSPSWDSTTGAGRVFQMRIDDSNYIELTYGSGKLWFTKYVSGTKYETTSNSLTSSKYQVENFLAYQTTTKFGVAFLFNNGTFTRFEMSNSNLLNGTCSFNALCRYLVSTGLGQQINSFAESFNLYDLETLQKVRFGGELVANGGFSSGGAGWSPGAGTWAYTGGVASITTASLTDRAYGSLLTVVPSGVYKLKGNITGGGALMLNYYTSDGVTLISTSAPVTGTSADANLTMPSNCYYVRVYLHANNVTVGTQLTFDNVSFKQVLKDGFDDYEAESILRSDNKYYQTTTSGYTGKIAGSTIANPNIIKTTASSVLKAPSEFIGEWSQAGYDYAKILDSSTGASGSSVNAFIPQQLFSFDLISIVERKYGEIPNCSTVAQKITWLESNVKTTTVNWYGYGSNPTGNKAYLVKWTPWNSTYGTAISNTSSSPALLTITRNMTTGDIIDSNGFVHYVAYTDASNGTIASTIYTDYVSLDVTVKTGNTSAYVPNKELFDINAVTLHANATRSNGVITLNANGSWQNNYIYIPVLPNNKYIISGNITASASYGYVRVDGYYNTTNSLNGSALIQLATNSGVYSSTFTTPNNCNMVKIQCGNSVNGTFTFSNISIKLLM